MTQHRPVRNLIGALEKRLAESLATAGYTVMNTVKWKFPVDEKLWRRIRKAFLADFPRLENARPRVRRKLEQIAKR
jgi:hypothetical protein